MTRQVQFTLRGGDQLDTVLTALEAFVRRELAQRPPSPLTLVAKDLISRINNSEEAWNARDIVEIKREHHSRWMGASNLWVVEETTSGRFSVQHHTPDGVAPPSQYPTIRKAAARLLQLFGCGAVAPQTTPEEVCIGTVTSDGNAP